MLFDYFEAGGPEKKKKKERNERNLIDEMTIRNLLR